MWKIHTCGQCLGLVSEKYYVSFVYTEESVLQNTQYTEYSAKLLGNSNAVSTDENYNNQIL